ncbi:MAG: acyltransferase [Bacteroidaceae bacterium]|nr:acyltransferase [Bacteroidaceae bacterium]
MKTRTIYFDVLRIIAILLVIACHAPMVSPALAGASIFPAINKFLCCTGVPLFFMISGALLLDKEIKVSAFDYLKKRIGKVLFPTLFFTLLVIFIKSSFVLDEYGNENMLRFILSIPFSTRVAVLWFMYVLIGLYLLIPILSPWLSKVGKKELHLYLGLWMVSLLYPWLTLVLSTETSVNGILYYFSGYVGYFILGLYLKRYDISLKLLLPASLIAISLPFVVKVVLHSNVSIGIFAGYLTLPAMVLAATFFMIAKKYAHKIPSMFHKGISLVSDLCFGIYLWHIVVRFYVLGRMDYFIGIDNFYVQYIVVLVLTFILSLLISYLVSWIPGAQYIIGYSSRQKK